MDHVENLKMEVRTCAIPSSFFFSSWWSCKRKILSQLGKSRKNWLSFYQVMKQSKRSANSCQQRQKNKQLSRSVWTMKLQNMKVKMMNLTHLKMRMKSHHPRASLLILMRRKRRIKLLRKLTLMETQLRKRKRRKQTLTILITMTVKASTFGVKKAKIGNSTMKKTRSLTSLASIRCRNPWIQTPFHKTLTRWSTWRSALTTKK